jgi:hypothetical protein
MAVNSEATATSAQFAQIVKSVKQLTVREQLTLEKVLLYGLLASHFWMMQSFNALTHLGGCKLWLLLARPYGR